MGLDGVLELFQLFRVEMLAWLIGILIDHSNRHAATRHARGSAITQNGVQPLTHYRLA